MKKHLLLLLCSIFLIITSCNDHDDNTESKNLFTSQLIGKGIITANYVVQQNTVMTNSAQWNQFLNQIDTPTHQTSAVLPKPTSILMSLWQLLSLMKCIRTVVILSIL